MVVGEKRTPGSTSFIPDHRQSLKIIFFFLLIFLPSVHNRIFLLNFPINLMHDQRRSVEYSARYTFFFFYYFFFLLFMLAPTFLKKTINSHMVILMRAGESIRAANSSRYSPAP